MLISELGYGGAEGALVRLARELAERHAVEIVVFKENYAVAGYTAIDLPAGLRLHRLDHPNDESRLGRWIRRLRGLRAIRASFGADATISFLTGPNLLNVLAGGPGKTIVSIRGSRRHDAHAGRPQKWLYRWLVDPVVNRRADAIVCVSHGLTLEIAGRRNRQRGKFHTVSGYVDPAQLASAAREPVEPRLEPLAAMPVIVAAGRLSPEKGFQHLIRVFAGVHETIKDSKLLLIGDGPYRRQLEQACSSFGLTYADAGPDLSADVLFLGYRANPNRYFRLARVFVLPSASEGFPNILIEALAAGVPVAAGDVPWGTREVLGVAADPGNRPYPRTEPLETDHGMLMPRIDEPRFQKQWIKVLGNYLAHAPEDPAAAERRKARVDQLSCRAAAAKWSDLLESLQR